MGRAALELLGQGALGYSFDPLVDDTTNDFAEAVKSFLYVFTCHLFPIQAFSISITTGNIGEYRTPEYPCKMVCDWSPVTSLLLLACGAYKIYALN